jgi:CDP-diacylglycerol--glycerol-3-phosphate 3-phosphatidyltransferase
MTIPNVLTFSRLLLTPVIIYLAYFPDVLARWTALVLFVLAGLSDCLDGLLARKLKQISPLGTFLDPVVDKIVLLSLFFVLSDLHLVPLWISLLMLTRELLVDGVRSAGAMTGRLVGANFMGKTKATLQSICIGIGLGMWALTWPQETIRLWLTWIAGFTLLAAWVFAFVFLWWQRAWLFATGEPSQHR